MIRLAGTIAAIVIAVGSDRPVFQRMGVLVQRLEHTAAPGSQNHDHDNRRNASHHNGRLILRGLAEESKEFRAKVPRDTPATSNPRPAAIISRGIISGPYLAYSTLLTSRSTVTFTSPG
jgi:hypothetical protein